MFSKYFCYESKGLTVEKYFAAKLLTLFYEAKGVFPLKVTIPENINLVLVEEELLKINLVLKHDGKEGTIDFIDYDMWKKRIYPTEKGKIKGKFLSGNTQEKNRIKSYFEKLVSEKSPCLFTTIKENEKNIKIFFMLHDEKENPIITWMKRRITKKNKHNSKIPEMLVNEDNIKTLKKEFPTYKVKNKNGLFTIKLKGKSFAQGFVKTM